MKCSLSLPVLLALILPTPEASGTSKCDLGARKRKCRTIDIANFSKEPSILYGEAHGRFGNQFLGYAVLLQFKRSFGFQSFINKDCKFNLDLYFTPAFNELPILQEAICNWKDIPWEAYNGHFRDFYNDPSYRKGRFIRLWPPNEHNPFGYRPEDHMCKEQDAFNEELTKYMRSVVRFPPHISEAVDASLRRVADKYASLDTPIEFVGIHSRRTDHHEFMKKNFNVDPLDLSYYTDAMEYFREDLEEEGITPVFIFVSDDMEWGRKRLGKEKDIYFLGKGTRKGVNTKLENQVYDFALLTRCNKTIVGRGTYALWVTILNDGEHYTEYGPVAFNHLQ